MVTDAYTTAGSHVWVCPLGVTTVTVECVGSGGGGQPATTSSGGGAKGGGYASSDLAVTPGNSYDVRVGAGGPSTGTVVVRNGVVSEFGPVGSPLVRATGGQAGGPSGTSTPGTLEIGGPAIGATTTAGTSGEAGLGGAGGYGGAGGAGAPPRGGAGGARTVTGVPGNPGVAPGGGGSGSRLSSGLPGGAGGDGAVYITYANPPITIHPAKITSTGTVHAPAIVPYVAPVDGNINITAELEPATKHAACIQPDRSAEIEPARHIAGVNAT